MILLLDNNDSFTYNLLQIFDEFGAVTEVVKSQDIKIEEVSKYSGIVLSPGPETPDCYPKMKQIIHKYHTSKPILGVCLGHQAICEYFGAKLYKVHDVKHGIMSELIITVDEKLYKNLASPVKVGRYHSWAVSRDLPNCLEITAIAKDGVIMSVKHREYNLTGIQYHPESVITNQGKKILNNWLEYKCL